MGIHCNFNVLFSAIIEGEGHFSFLKSYNKYTKKIDPMIGVTNQDISLLKYTKLVIGDGNLSFSKQKNGRIIGHYQLYGYKSLFHLTNQIIPYLFNKKGKAMKIRDYCEYIINDSELKKVKLEKRFEDIINKERQPIGRPKNKVISS